jgi:hypothetical protein
MLGVGLTWQVERDYPGWTDTVLAALGSAPYHNWNQNRPVGNGYMPSLFRVLFDDETQPTKPYARAVARAQANPQELWALGNEPYIAESGLIDPVTFSEVVWDWWRLTGNPWAMAGVILDAKGYEWLEGYLRTQAPLPDYWHVHVYWCDTPQEWRAKLDAFYLWAHQRNVSRPVIVTETCARRGEPEAQMRLMDYLAEASELCCWYSGYDWFRRWPWTDLANLDGTLTPLGEHFAQLMGPSAQVGEHTIHLPMVEG